MFHDLFVNDETEHFALRRLYDSLMLFGGCPCSRCVAYRRSYCCVEQSETVFEHVISRCQLLPVLVKQRPGCPDSILDFGRLLLPERDHLAQVSHAFTRSFSLHRQCCCKASQGVAPTESIDRVVALPFVLAVNSISTRGVSTQVY